MNMATKTSVLLTWEFPESSSPYRFTVSVTKMSSTQHGGEIKAIPLGLFKSLTANSIYFIHKKAQVFFFSFFLSSHLEAILIYLV